MTKELGILFVKLISIIVMLVMAFEFAKLLWNEYGLLSTFGFLVSLGIGIIEGRIIENPGKVAIYGVAYALTATAVRAAIEHTINNFADPISMVIGLIVIGFLWRKGNELKS